MDDLLRQIGNRILNRRKQLRMTQEDLAEKAGITPQTVSSAELGKKHFAGKYYPGLFCPPHQHRLPAPWRDKLRRLFRFALQDFKPSSHTILPHGGYYQQFYPGIGRKGSAERKMTSLCFLAAPKR